MLLRIGLDMFGAQDVLDFLQSIHQSIWIHGEKSLYSEKKALGAGFRAQGDDIRIPGNDFCSEKVLEQDNVLENCKQGKSLPNIVELIQKESPALILG